MITALRIESHAAFPSFSFQVLFLAKIPPCSVFFLFSNEFVIAENDMGGSTQPWNCLPPANHPWPWLTHGHVPNIKNYAISGRSHDHPLHLYLALSFFLPLFALISKVIQQLQQASCFCLLVIKEDLFMNNYAFSNSTRTGLGAFWHYTLKDFLIGSWLKCTCKSTRILWSQGLWFSGRTLSS